MWVAGTCNVRGTYAEGMAVAELVARSVAGDVQSSGAIAGTAAEGGDPGVGCLGQKREDECRGEVCECGSREVHRGLRCRVTVIMRTAVVPVGRLVSSSVQRRSIYSKTAQASSQSRAPCAGMPRSLVNAVTGTCDRDPGLQQDASFTGGRRCDKFCEYERGSGTGSNINESVPHPLSHARDVDVLASSREVFGRYNCLPSPSQNLSPCTSLASNRWRKD